MAVNSVCTIAAFTAQAIFLFGLVSCAICANIPVAAISEQNQVAKQNGVLSEGQVISTATGTLPISRSSLPIVTSTDDFEVVQHTGSDGLGRQKRYVGWGRRPSLRYNKAVSVFDHDSLFNRLHNAFEKRGAGPGAPISSFRELRMKQKVPNIQLLLPHLPMRNTRVPAYPEEDGEETEADMPSGRLTQEDLDTLAYMLDGQK